MTVVEHIWGHVGVLREGICCNVALERGEVLDAGKSCAVLSDSLEGHERATHSTM